jgi:hypothetical protein
VLSDVALANAILQDEGLNREEAARIIALDPGLTFALRDRIAEKRAELEAEAKAEADRRYAASPEGRAQAAKAALQARREREELAEGSRELLRQRGIPEDYISSLSAADLLVEAGIEPSKHQKAEQAAYERSLWKAERDGIPTNPEPISTGHDLFKEGV